MRRVQLFLVCKIIDRSRNFQYSVVAAGGEMQLTHSRAHHVFAGFIKHGMVLQFSGSHVRIGVKCCVLETLGLDFTSAFDSTPQIGGRLTGAAVGQLLIIDLRHFDVDIDPVEERTADSFLITSGR